MLSLDYIAGFIDGEGCFGDHPVLHIVNNDKAVLEQIKDTISELTNTSASINIVWRGANDSHRTTYILRIGSPMLRKLLPMLTEHLVVKKCQAEVVSQLLELIPPRGQRTKVSLSNRKQREYLSGLLSWLNQGRP